jgi:nucleoside-diphosphate-sugar epimerase
MKVILTGAAGNVGSKVRKHLESRSGYALCSLDLEPRNDPSIVKADLCSYEKGWVELFAGADAVIHLAANPKNDASWEELIGPNIDALLNVYLASHQHRVRRVIFASSVWVMAGELNDQKTLHPVDVANPGQNAYGATKLFGEHVSKAFAEAYGMETVSIRLGACRPDRKEPVWLSKWEQSCRISDEDVGAGFERALKADVSGATVVNLTSKNESSRWSLDEARVLLGFEPVDSYASIPTAPTYSKRSLVQRAKQRLWRAIRN